MDADQSTASRGRGRSRGRARGRAQLRRGASTLRGGRARGRGRGRKAVPGPVIHSSAQRGRRRLTRGRTKRIAPDRVHTNEAKSEVKPVQDENSAKCVGPKEKSTAEDSSKTRNLLGHVVQARTGGGTRFIGTIIAYNSDSGNIRIKDHETKRIHNIEHIKNIDLDYGRGFVDGARVYVFRKKVRHYPQGDRWGEWKNGILGKILRLDPDTGYYDIELDEDSQNLSLCPVGFGSKNLTKISFNQLEPARDVNLMVNCIRRSVPCGIGGDDFSSLFAATFGEEAEPSVMLEVTNSVPSICDLPKLPWYMEKHLTNAKQHAQQLGLIPKPEHSESEPGACNRGLKCPLNGAGLKIISRGKNVEELSTFVSRVVKDLLKGKTTSKDKLKYYSKMLVMGDKPKGLTIDWDDFMIELLEQKWIEGATLPESVKKSIRKKSDEKEAERARTKQPASKADGNRLSPGSNNCSRNSSYCVATSTHESKRDPTQTVPHHRARKRDRNHDNESKEDPSSKLKQVPTVRWKYEAGAGIWDDCDAKFSSTCEAALQNGKQQIQIDRSGMTYTVHLDASTYYQINNETGQFRFLKRLGPDFSKSSPEKQLNPLAKPFVFRKQPSCAPPRIPQNDLRFNDEPLDDIDDHPLEPSDIADDLNKHNDAKLQWILRKGEWEEVDKRIHDVVMRSFLSKKESYKTDYYRFDFVTMVVWDLKKKQSFPLRVKKSDKPKRKLKMQGSKQLLQKSSDEYEKVKSKFYSSVPESLYAIHSIERITCEAKDAAYDNQKILFEKTCQNGADERQVWHGTKKKNVDKIINQGFIRHLGEVMAYGDGCYFASEASGSLSYAKPDATLMSYMFMCDILVGDYTVGSGHMKVPPSKPGLQNVPYETLTDDSRSPRIFVATKDDQARPRYLITFKSSRLRDAYNSYGSSNYFRRNRPLSQPYRRSRYSSSYYSTYRDLREE